MKYSVEIDELAVLPYILMAIDEDYDEMPNYKRRLFLSNNAILIEAAKQILEQQEPEFKEIHNIGLFTNLHAIHRSVFFGSVLYQMEKALNIANKNRKPSELLIFKVDDDVTVIKEYGDEEQDSPSITH